MPTDPRFKVEIPADVLEVMREYARTLSGRLPPEWGFTLLIFTYGEGGAMTYISSAERADMLKAMYEFIRVQAEA